MTIDTNLANWNKENELGSKSVRFAKDGGDGSLYKNSKKSSSNSPTSKQMKTPQKSPKPQKPEAIQSKQPEVEARENEWEKIREKIPDDEAGQNEQEIMNEVLRLCSWWNLPEYDGDDDNPWSEAYLLSAKKRKSPYRSSNSLVRRSSLRSDESSSSSSSEGGSSQALSVGLSSLRLDSNMLPYWMEKDEDSQSSTDSGYKSDIPAQNHRKPFGQRQEASPNSFEREVTQRFMEIEQATKKTPLVRTQPMPTKLVPKKSEFWQDLSSVEF